MHGADDVLISPYEAKLNYGNVKSKIKKLEILKGVGHNDMMMADSYFITLKQFFDSWGSLWKNIITLRVWSVVDIN